MITTETHDARRRVVLVASEWPRAMERAEALVLRGWEVDIATTADHAIAILDQVLPDALIAEGDLAGSIGAFELAARLKKDARTQHLAIVALPEASPSTSALIDALDREVALANLLARRRASREGRVESTTSTRLRFVDQGL